ncbi:hypothetical protein Dimus_027232 [Dionaea muscipula]
MFLFPISGAVPPLFLETTHRSRRATKHLTWPTTGGDLERDWRSSHREPEATHDPRGDNSARFGGSELDSSVGGAHPEWGGGPVVVCRGCWSPTDVRRGELSWHPPQPARRWFLRRPTGVLVVKDGARRRLVVSWLPESRAEIATVWISAVIGDESADRWLVVAHGYPT